VALFRTEEVVVTNTIPLREDQRSKKITSLSVAPLLAEADAFAHRHGLSRSDLFARSLRIVFAAAGLLSPP
jgi:phosphoribosylpyrophosphate synthetase